MMWSTGPISSVSRSSATIRSGSRKAELAAEFVASLNPHVEVHAVAQRLTGDNAETLLAGHDLVIDGCDNFATRLVGRRRAHSRSAFRWSPAAAVQFQGQVGCFRGWEADKPCYRCFVGDAFDSDDCDTCAELGVLGALTGPAGSFAALMAIRAIVGIGEDVAGKLFLFDGAEARLAKNPPAKGPGLPDLLRLGSSSSAPASSCPSTVPSQPSRRSTRPPAAA